MIPGALPSLGTAAANGRLWGARAREWADVQEGQFRAAYTAVFTRAGLAPGAAYCDVGCSSGLAAALAAERGARVVVITWGTPAGMEACSLVAALKPLLPASALRAFAARAGLAPDEVTAVACPWVYADLATALRGLGSSGVAVRAREQSGEAAVDQAHAAALAPFRQGDGSYRLHAAFRWLIAQA